jgi:excisionase family DNA binding protein
MAPADLSKTLDAIPAELIPQAIAILAARAMVPPQPPALPAPKALAGKSLTAEEAAHRLGVSTRWVYRHATQLGALRLSARTLRVPESAVERYLKHCNSGR